MRVFQNFHRYFLGDTTFFGVSISKKFLLLLLEKWLPIYDKSFLYLCFIKCL